MKSSSILLVACTLIGPKWLPEMAVFHRQAPVINRSRKQCSSPDKRNLNPCHGTDNRTIGAGLSSRQCHVSMWQEASEQQPLIDYFRGLFYDVDMLLDSTYEHSDNASFTSKLCCQTHLLCSVRSADTISVILSYLPTPSQHSPAQLLVSAVDSEAVSTQGTVPLSTAGETGSDTDTGSGLGEAGSGSVLTISVIIGVVVVVFILAMIAGGVCCKTQCMPSGDGEEANITDSTTELRILDEEGYISGGGKVLVAHSSPTLAKLSAKEAMRDSPDWNAPFNYHKSPRDRRLELLSRDSPTILSPRGVQIEAPGAFPAVDI